MPAAVKTNDELFLEGLRHALNHLYDPEQLRTSRLVQLFALDGQHAVATRLQQLLLEAIEALRPATNEPAGAGRRRIHQVLQLRYEQQFAQKEVATQLGLSVRQFRRLQQVALESLAASLIATYGLAERLDHASAVGAPRREDVDVETMAGELPQSLQWILGLSPAENTATGQALSDVVRLVQPLAHHHHKQLVWHGGVECVAAIHPLILRQAMVHLLNTAILHTPGSEIAISVICEGVEVSICVRSGAGGVGADQVEDGGEEAEIADWDNEEAMVRQMLGVWHCALCIVDHGDQWQAELRCKRAQEQPVLVVDDHAETIDLLKRCLEGTGYRMIATHEPQRALGLALEEQPCAILLDVMMPDMDGWEVLTRLKQHEATAAIPVIVCTVLDQSELALSLGAYAFVRKPIRREALLALLDAQPVREPARR